MKNSFNDRLLTSLGKFVYRKRIAVLIISLLLSLGAFHLASQIEMHMSWLAIAPQKFKSMIELKSMMKEFGGITPIILTAKSETPLILEKL